MAGSALNEGNEFYAEKRGQRERIVAESGLDCAEEFFSEFVDVVFDEAEG